MPRKSDEEFIINLKPGQEIESYFAISGIEARTGRAGKFLHFVLSDKTRGITVTYWSGAETDEKEVELRGTQTVKIKGLVQEFEGKINILINPSLEHYVEAYQITESELPDLTRVSPKDRKALLTKILDTISNLKNPHLKKILNSLFGDSFFKDKFYDCPGAKARGHHGYIGGLLEHTEGVLTLCESACKVYPELDRDLLLASAILHDIGKLRCYDYDPLTIEYSKEGILLGSVMLTENMISEKIKELGDIPEDLRIKLLHVVLSHHGETEKGWGSPVSPQIPEAFVLHHADNLDAKVKKSVEEASLTQKRSIA